jgi:hypothetical protein
VPNREIPQPQEGAQSAGEPPSPQPPPGPPAMPAPPPKAARVVRSIPVQRPPFRRLRAYAFDPTLSTELENAVINHVTLEIPWEFDPKTGLDKLEPGPVGEYLEVVDFDPASDCFYSPVDLDQPYLLAQDGLAPSEGNPHFHQQMVYAVAMGTIHNFERALGRTVLWAPHRSTAEGVGGPVYHEEYVPRLRIYPHALREANAYYSPEKKALLFGYFPASTLDSRHHLPGGLVFTCLSHDVVAHETTHAILDGMHRRFIEASNPDVLAFHEAFADVVALFQHFSFPEVLRHQIARTQGNLATENLLAQLAQEFGQATGAHGALRDALGDVDDEGRWVPKQPDPARIRTETEPHARGSLLVAAVFAAFVSIYKSRTAALFRIATGGTGVLPAGALHPDLVDRLAGEAAKSAKHILNMCIRALDYCPPVDITFGDYLRALITADHDLVRDDDLGYRIAVVEAFRHYGIYPLDVRSLSVDSLLWSAPAQQDFRPTFLRSLKALKGAAQTWDLRRNRRDIDERLRKLRAKLHDRIDEDKNHEQQLLKGLDLSPGKKFEVHSLRPARRVGPDGDVLADLVIEITQRRPIYLDSALQNRSDAREKGLPKPDFYFRGGGTLIVDLKRFEVRYNIYKDITSESRLARQRAFFKGDGGTSLRALYMGAPSAVAEPFAMLHRSAGQEEIEWVR